MVSRPEDSLNAELSDAPQSPTTLPRNAFILSSLIAGARPVVDIAKPPVKVRVLNRRGKWREFYANRDGKSTLGSQPVSRAPCQKPSTPGFDCWEEIRVRADGFWLQKMNTNAARSTARWFEYLRFIFKISDAFIGTST